MLAISEYFRKATGGEVIQVCTFKTEATKSAIKTAARALGLDDALASYVASLVPAERGAQLSFDVCLKGDEDHSPVKGIVEAMEQNPQWKKIILRIGGLITGLGAHASGILLCNDPLYTNNAMMKTTSGIGVSAFDLHDSEYLGYVKYDALSIDGAGKLTSALYFLLQNNEIEWQGSLRKTYEHYLLPSNLKSDEKLWENIANNKISDLFQLSTDVGQQGVALVKPDSLEKLGIINSVMRLQAQTKNAEQPINTYARYHEDIELWYSEMRVFGLNEKEISILEKHLKILSGVADSQESIMLMVMDPEIAGFTVPEANKLRKGVAKKSPKAQQEVKELFYTKGRELGTDETLLDYVWKVQITRLLGYAFSVPHTAAYSMIALQQANIYTYYPSVYWNVACLASDSGTNVEEDFADLISRGYIQIPIAKRLNLINAYETFAAEEQDNEYTEDELNEWVRENYENPEEEEEEKAKAIDRGKIASSLSKYLHSFNIEATDINKSGFNFKPNSETNSIICGLKLVGKINSNLIKQIIEKRPYKDLTDFVNRVTISKDRVVNLIKAGAFDSIEQKTRKQLLKTYVLTRSDQKQKLNLSNAKMLFDKELLPFPEERKIFNWYKYVTKTSNKFNGESYYYIMDERALIFFNSQNYNLNEIVEMYDKKGESYVVCSKKYLKNIYDNAMIPIKQYILDNTDELIISLNKELFSLEYEKYKCDNDLQGEMQSMRIYLSGHELENIRFNTVDICGLNSLEDEEIDKYFTTKDGISLPIYKIRNLIGTVINKNKLKNTVTILTTEGPIDLKVWKDTFALYDKKIVHLVNGKEMVQQPSFFANGTHLIVSGFKRGNNFVLKKYKNSQLPEVLMKLHLENGQARPEVKISE